MSAPKTPERRKLLIGLASGVIGTSQLPGSWSKPIVDAVVLPAHAETTDDSGTLPPENTTTAEPVITEFSGAYASGDSSAKNDMLDDALALMVPDAHAGFIAANGQICIKVSPPVGSGASYTAIIQVNQGDSSAIFTGTGTVNGGNASLAVDNSCGNQILPPPSFEVTSVSNAGAAYSISVSGATNTNGMLGTEYNCPTNECV